MHLKNAKNNNLYHNNAIQITSENVHVPTCTIILTILCGLKKLKVTRQSNYFSFTREKNIFRDKITFYDTKGEKIKSYQLKII